MSRNPWEGTYLISCQSYNWFQSMK